MSSGAVPGCLRRARVTVARTGADREPTTCAADADRWTASAGGTRGCAPGGPDHSPDNGRPQCPVRRVSIVPHLSPGVAVRRLAHAALSAYLPSGSVRLGGDHPQDDVGGALVLQQRPSATRRSSPGSWNRAPAMSSFVMVRECLPPYEMWCRSSSTEFRSEPSYPTRALARVRDAANGARGRTVTGPSDAAPARPDRYSGAIRATVGK
jgi:hypothetical protein